MELILAKEILKNSLEIAEQLQIGGIVNGLIYMYDQFFKFKNKVLT